MIYRLTYVSLLVIAFICYMAMWYLLIVGK